MYEVTFTESFKDGLQRLPKEIHPIIDRQLAQLASDPFGKNPNATRLKNVPCSFRARIGMHVRMLYRVQSKIRRVIVQTIGTRENIYDQKQHSLLPLPPDEVKAILAEIAGARLTPRPAAAPTIPAIAPAPVVLNIPIMCPHGAVPELPVVIEELPWMTEDQLFLLHIPESSWKAVLISGSADALQKLAVDDWIKATIADYWTNPASNQVDRLYGLGQGQGAEAIAQQPLSHFLVALDPEQKEALKKVKLDGPYLLKGSAGTGKSLVGLYHIRDMANAGAGANLFGSGSGKYGVITYTNALVGASSALLQKIATSGMQNVECTTLDKISYALAQKELGKTPLPLSTDGIASWIEDRIAPNIELPNAATTLGSLGYIYVAEEIEQVILGHGIDALADYLSHKREGRKRSLREAERRVIWRAFEDFRALGKTKNVQTFEGLRLLALKFLKANPSYPRYAALFVDEAQDLSKTARQLCLELVMDPRHLLLAADTGQSIYTVPPTWKASDPRLDFVRRKPIKLERSYRATKQIGQAIAPLRLELDDGEEPSGNSQPVFSGPKPLWTTEPIAGHPAIVSKLVNNYAQDKVNPVHLGQIAIIVRENSDANRYVSVLAKGGVLAKVVDKLHPLSIDQNHVHVITAHSSKGLGFPVVIVTEVSAKSYPWHASIAHSKDATQLEQILDAEQRLLYVALSRASHQLHMIVDQTAPSPFVKKLNRNDWR